MSVQCFTKKKFGEVSILRPSQKTVTSLKNEAKTHLEQKFSSGKYLGKYGTAILNELFNFYDGILRSTIPEIASRNASDLLLFQYDECQKILHGNGISDLEERRGWKEIEGNVRRALKYMVELVCSEGPGEVAEVSEKMAIQAFETALFAAESTADLAEMSERTNSTFPDQFFVYLDFTRRDDYLMVRIEGFDERFYDRLRADRQSRDNFLTQPQYDINVKDHCRFIDDSFRKEFGATYGEFIHILREVINGSQPAEKGFPTLFIHRDDMISQISEISKLPASAVEKALNGFTVNPEVLKSEGRNLWNPKQPSRAFRRGFFLFPHPSGVHLTFSEGMAVENMIHLVSSVPYQKLPEEWSTLTSKKAAKSISNEAGDWFEKQVIRNLGALGYVGGSVKHRIRHQEQLLTVPAEVGQLDFFGVDKTQNILLFVERKMVLSGLEARVWRDDLDRFVGRKNSHRSQTLRKLNWIKDYREEIGICFGLKENYKIAGALVTLYPCIADEVIEEFRCVSLAELIFDHRRASGWPYRFLNSS